MGHWSSRAALRRRLGGREKCRQWCLSTQCPRLIGDVIKLSEASVAAWSQMKGASAGLLAYGHVGTLEWQISAQACRSCPSGVSSKSSCKRPCELISSVAKFRKLGEKANIAKKIYTSFKHMTVWDFPITYHTNVTNNPKSRLLDRLGGVDP